MPISFDWSKTIEAIPANPIPPAWLATKGAGVKVAFVDTGVNLGINSLKHLDKAGRKFFTGATGFSVTKLVGQDLVGEFFGGSGPGHGTLYATLLAGKTPDSSFEEQDTVAGIAPEADFYLIKARNRNDRKTTIQNLLDALELSANLGIEVLITGQCISASEMPFEGITDADVERVFALPAVQRMAIFAPLKNLADTDSWDNICADNFPCLRPDVFNVAVLPNHIDALAPIIQAQPISFLPSGFKGTVLSKTGDAIELNWSNSGAVALMGGIAVLAVSAFKSQHGGNLPKLAELQQWLGTACQPLPNAAPGTNQPAIFKNY